MSKYFHIVILLLGLLISSSAWAEVIRLKSGKQVEGEIVFRNDEVVVVRDANGKRFQYPMTDVEAIGERESDEPQREEEDVQVADAPNTPKVSICLGLNGGVAIQPSPAMSDNAKSLPGGGFGADFSVGTYSLLKRKIFLGGGLGFHAFLLDGKTYSFLPVTLRAEVPLTQTKHAPVLGLGAGYGIGLGGVQGGFYGALQFGWKVSYGRKGGFFLGLYGDLQRVKISVTETISGSDYTSEKNQSLYSFGIKTALYF